MYVDVVVVDYYYKRYICMYVWYVVVVVYYEKRYTCMYVCMLLFFIIIKR